VGRRGLWVWRITDRKSDPVVRVLCPGVRRSTYGVGVHVSLRFLYRRRYSREPAPHVCILQSRDVYVRMGWAWQAPSLFGLTRRPYQRPERGSVLATADLHGSQTSRELASMTPFVTRGAVPGGRCDLRTEPAGIDATCMASRPRLLLHSIRGSLFSRALRHGPDTGALLVTRPHDRCSDTVSQEAATYH
jgi:hypothetical protein